LTVDTKQNALFTQAQLFIAIQCTKLTN